MAIEEWGAFDIARKVQQSGKTLWECRCPFHKKSKDTMCKRTIEFTENTKDHALIAARWWCNQALFHTRQKTHRKCFDQILGVPYNPLDVLIAERINEKPVQAPLTDAELDMRERRGRRRDQGRSRGTASNARARGRRRGRGRGRGRSRGTAFSSSSSSSSS